MHGDPHCPEDFEDDPDLAAFVVKLRTSYKKYMKGHQVKNFLNEERIEKLEEVGFLWHRHDVIWERHFNKLMAFKKEHGGFDGVLSLSDKKLSIWVASQRSNYKLFLKTGKGPTNIENRIKILNEVGFPWGGHANSTQHKR